MPGKNNKREKMTNTETCCTLIPKTNLEKKIRQKIDQMSEKSLSSDLVLKNKKLFAFVKKVCVKLPKLNENKVTKHKLALPHNRKRPKSLKKGLINSSNEAYKSPAGKKALSGENSKSSLPIATSSPKSSSKASAEDKAKLNQSSTGNTKSKQSSPNKPKPVPARVEKHKPKSPSPGLLPKDKSRRATPDKETSKSKVDSVVKEKSKKSTSSNSKDTIGRKRKHADQPPGPKNKKAVETPAMKKIFIRLPLLSGKGNKINKVLKPDRKIKPLSTRTEPSYLDRDKNAPIKKLGRTYLSEKFGSIFLRCHVKLKRLTPNDSTDFIKIPKAKKTQNRKSVSFVETVEVFGDSDIEEYEDDENDALEANIEEGVEINEDTVTDVGLTEDALENENEKEDSNINDMNAEYISDSEKNKELDGTNKEGNKSKFDLDAKSIVMTTVHADGLSHLIKVKKIVKRRLSTLDYGFEKAGNRSSHPSAEISDSIITEDEKDSDTEFNNGSENSLKEASNAASTLAKEQTHSSDYERLNGTNELNSNNRNDNLGDESSGIIRTFEEQESDDEILHTSETQPSREVDDEKLDTSESKERDNNKANFKTVEKEISDNELKLLNDMEEDRDERENNVTEETITATRIEHNEADNEEHNEEYQPDEEEIEKDKKGESEADRKNGKDGRDVKQTDNESNINTSEENLMTDDDADEQIENTKSRSPLTISAPKNEITPIENSQLQDTLEEDIFNDESMFDVGKTNPSEVLISHSGTSSSCQDKLIYSSEDESNPADSNMMSDIAEIENELKDLVPTLGTTSHIALFDKSPLTKSNEITLNAAVSTTTPIKLSNISTSSSEEDHLSYSEVNTNRNLTKTTSESLNLNDTAAPPKSDDSNFSLNNLFKSIKNKILPNTPSKSFEKATNLMINNDDVVADGDTGENWDELLNPLVDDVSSGIPFSQNVDDENEMLIDDVLGGKELAIN